MAIKHHVAKIQRAGTGKGIVSVPVGITEVAHTCNSGKGYSKEAALKIPAVTVQLNSEGVTTCGSCGARWQHRGR